MMTIEDEECPRIETEPVLGWIADRPGPWFALVWMPVLLLGPVIDSSVDGRLLQVGSLLLLAAFFAFTVYFPFRIRAGRRWRTEAVFVIFMVLCAAYLVAWQTDQGFVFPLLAIAAAIAVRRRWALSIIFSMTLSGAFAAGFEQQSLDAALFLGFSTFFAGVGNFMVLYLVELVGERTRNQERLAHAAVAEERVRFSRDLHDLLGHTLSVIVVKAEAIRRLVASDPNAAAEHAENIETIGRTALAEVRETVTGYRSVSLREEVVTARAALSAGNIEVEVTLPPDGLEARMDSLLGWVVREGVTNVLRHAEAGDCRIVVSTGRGSARVEITDDGRGGRAGDGSGLRGLRERVEEVGGELTAMPTPSGFRLAASVPEHALIGRR